MIEQSWVRALLAVALVLITGVVAVSLKKQFSIVPEEANRDFVMISLLAIGYVATFAVYAAFKD